MALDIGIPKKATESATVVRSILIVDDNPADVLLAKLALKPFGLHDSIVNIPNGHETLTYLSSVERLPDFIILDVNLPGLSGFEILQSIRDHPDFALLKVAMFTSAYMPDEELLKYTKPDKFIIKPFTFDGYAEVLQNLCTDWLNL
jgi:CheY-like chemotaxis protein